jgi:hypothetical protein
MDAGTHYLADIRVQVAKLKALAEGAIAQVTDEQLFQCIGQESNSIAIVMRHVGGNLRSRFTDFLTRDGEKPDRKRDGEFTILPGTSRETIVAEWEAGFTCVNATLQALTPDDLLRDVYIRAERFSVIQALHRALTHLAYHVGQIVVLAKQLQGSNWRTLSIPRGQSDQFTGLRRF